MPNMPNIPNMSNMPNTPNILNMLNISNILKYLKKHLKNIFNRLRHFASFSWFNNKDKITSEVIFTDNKDKGDKGDKSNYENPVLILESISEESEESGVYTPVCDYSVNIPNFSKSRDSILIIDDNEGMVSFLKDDLDYFNLKNIIDYKKINVITMSSKLAGFIFEATQRKMNGLNIKYAIIDITLGGSVMGKTGNIKYTGVDVYEMIIEYNPEVRFIFYTGNNLNPHINANKKIIDQFYNLTKKDIKEFILFKTSLDMDSRRKYIAKHLFDKEI